MTLRHSNLAQSSFSVDISNFSENDTNSDKSLNFDDSDFSFENCDDNGPENEVISENMLILTSVEKMNENLKNFGVLCQNCGSDTIFYEPTVTDGIRYFPSLLAL